MVSPFLDSIHREGSCAEPRGKLIRVAVSHPSAKRRVGDVVFVQADPHRAVELFRRGKLDVAPVPLGDIQDVLRDPQLRPAVRLRRLNAIDLVVAVPGGALDHSAEPREGMRAFMEKRPPNWVPQEEG